MTPTRHDAPVVDGGFRRDEQVLSRCGGRLRAHRAPDTARRAAARLRRDVAATVRWAARRGRRFAPQGRRHSVFGRSQVSGGVVADMTQLRTVHAVERRPRASSTPGRRGARCSPRRCRTDAPRPGSPTTSTSRSAAPWPSAVSALRSRGPACRATTSSTWRWSPAGASSSPARRTSDADLFDAVRAGLGQVGVITRATLRLVPAPAAGPPLPAVLPGPRHHARPTSVCSPTTTGSTPSKAPCSPLRPADGCSGSTPSASAHPPDASLLAGLSDDRPKAEGRAR